MSTVTQKPTTDRTPKEAMMARRRKELHQVEDVSSSVFDPYANANSANKMKRNRTGVAYDLETLKHKCEWDENYPENPQRLSSVFDRCQELGLISRCVTIPNTQNDVRDAVIKKHSEAVYSLLEQTSRATSIDAMEAVASKYDAVYFNEHTFDAACRSLSCVLNLVTAVADNSVHNGMALVRPPGHHAMHDEFCGYCFFNNVAIAAETCIERQLAKRILIVDYDVHHGQATQQMFYDRNDVLYFSIHRYEHGTFWPNLLESNFNFIGKGEGVGYNINVPLNEIGLNDADYLAIVFNILLPVAYEFQPDLIIVSGGYDSCIGDEKGKMLVTPGFYAHLITLLSGLANGKIAVCLEGGYFLPSLAEGAAMTLKALLGDPCPILDPVRSVNPAVVDTINNLQSILASKWSCFSVCEKSDATGGLNADGHKYLIKYFGEPPSPPYETRNCYPVQTSTEQNYFKKIVEALREKYSGVKLPVCYVYDEKMLLHKPAEGEAERPEKPERISVINQMFSDFGIHERCVKLDVTERDYSRYNLHDCDYLQTLSSSTVEQTKDVYFNSATNGAISTAVSGLLGVVDSVMTNSSGSGVAIIRPPGHHAELNKAMGFCFVNNVAIAANYLLKKYLTDRVLIVDFDVHHGNGTQNIFYHSKNVMYISVHRYDDGKFFPVKENANFTYDGFGCGQGFNVNIPLSKDKMGDGEYLAIFHKIILPIAYSFAPEVVLVSAGFDAGVNDPLGGYQVSPETFGHFVQFLKPLAGGKLILSLEGGYNLTTTGYAMAICTKVLLGDPVPMPKLPRHVSEQACSTIRDVSEHFEKYWPMLMVNRKLGAVPYLCKPVRRFTDDVRASEQLVRLDADRVEDSAYVEDEFKKF